MSVEYNCNETDKPAATTEYVRVAIVRAWYVRTIKTFFIRFLFGFVLRPTVRFTGENVEKTVRDFYIRGLSQK